MLAQLIPLDGGPPIELTGDITLVGRKTGVCDLVLERGSVSKMHCLIVKTDGLLFIRDLASTNGTKVNGQKVTRGALLPGDELAFASARYRVHLGPGRPAVDQQIATEMLSSLPGKNGDGSGGFAARNPVAKVNPFHNPHDSDADLRLKPDESAV
ncbi:MAG: FHA domain-containing protein [Planctomycetaceae bacterium]